MKSSNPLKEPNKRRITLAISGLDRAGVKAQALKDRLEAMAGIFRVFVNVSTEVLYVVYDSKQISPDDLNQVIRELGLEVEFAQYLLPNKARDNTQGN